MKEISSETVEPTDSTTTFAQLLEVGKKLKDLQRINRNGEEKIRKLIAKNKNVNG